MQVLTDSKSSNPVLLPNAELMELLEKDVAENEKFLQQQQQKSLHKKGKPRKSRFQHRDWIQQHVLEYLKGTPCVNIPTSKLSELKQRCCGIGTKTNTNQESSSSAHKSLPRKKRKVGDTNNNTNNNTNNHSPPKSPRSPAPESYGLTEAEALQVLNFMPQEMVEIHLMVEDLHDRMSEPKQEEFLQMIRSYNTSIDPNTNYDNDNNNGTDNDANANANATAEEEAVVEDSIELLETAGNGDDDEDDNKNGNNKVKTET